MSAAALVCPKCGAEGGDSYRRAAHAPCIACMVEGRGDVRMVPVNPPPPSFSEPPEPKRPAVLGEMSTATVAWDCDRNGHVFSGGSCGHCRMEAPDDPASAPEIRALEAAHKAARTLVALLLLACAYACGDCARVIADVTVTLDGGPAASHPVSYCADECQSAADCKRGYHCSLHPAGEVGLCFLDFNADGGR